MNRRIQILLISFMLALASAVKAQTTVTCGIVGIDGPAEVDPGKPIVFRVKVLQNSKPEFKWNVSAGTIIKGQGADEITVDTTGLGGQIVTARVELIGARAGCESSASKTTEVTPPPLIGEPLDRYGDINFEDEQARLDNFAIQLLNQPQSKGQIVMFAGQITFKGEAAYRLARAKSYLVGFRGIEHNRIITTDCGFAQDLKATLWVVPPGAEFVECDSYFQIPLSEVKFTKSRPKSSKKRR